MDETKTMMKIPPNDGN